MEIGNATMLGASLGAKASQQVDPQSVLSGKDPAEAAKQMERLFATMLVKEMRSALPSGFFGKGAGADIFEGWLDQHLGNSLADSGALDMAGQIKISIQNKQASIEQYNAELDLINGQQGEQQRTQESS